MQLYVIEGPGNTRTLPLETPESEQDFLAALNTNEALHWAVHFPDTRQSRLAKKWLKQNYGTDNVPKLRKRLAPRPKKTWQESPLTYAVVIVTLTVTGSLLTKYLSETLPPPQTVQLPPAAQQYVAPLFQNHLTSRITLPQQPPQPKTPTVQVTLPPQPETNPPEQAAPKKTSRFSRLLHWLHLR